MNKKLFVTLYLITINLFSSEQPLFTSQEFHLYSATRKLADLIFQSATTINQNPDAPFLLSFWTDWRTSKKVNPRYDRTDGGLLLEFYGDMPIAIRTPWGRWNFVGNKTVTWKKDERPLSTEDQVNLVYATLVRTLYEQIDIEYDPELSTKNRFGHVYKVRTISSMQLPAASQTKECFSFQDVKGIICPDQTLIEAKWDAMTKEYAKEKVRSQL